MDKRKLLGKRLKELRKSRKLTLAQLAEKIGVEPSSLGNIENGYNYPKMSTLEELSKALECGISNFFSFEQLYTEKDLITAINKKLNMHPDKIQEIYKIVVAITD